MQRFGQRIADDGIEEGEKVTMLAIAPFAALQGDNKGSLG